MSENNLMDYLRILDKGICDVCQSPIGHFGDRDNYFCYKCSGYELLKYEEAFNLIKRRKRRLREEFKSIAIKSDILYGLIFFLSIGETIFLNDKDELSIKPNTKDKKQIIKIDPSRIAIANMGVKWLLEDSLNHMQQIMPWNKAYCTNMMNLLRTWIDWNKKEKLSNKIYNLGFFVSKDNITSFFYTKQYDFYLESLNKFHIVSPVDEISTELVDNVLLNHKNLFQNPNKLQKFVRDEYPALVSTMLNAYYTNEIVRPYSFDDLMDKDNVKMIQFISQCDSDLANYLINKKRRYVELILALLENLYIFYENKRSTSINSITKDGFVVVRDLTDLTKDINEGKLPIPPFQKNIISSIKNHHHYPFIVEYNSTFIISPSRLWMGYRLLHYSLHKDRINNELAKKYEVESMLEIEKRLKKYGVVIIGKEIKAKKRGDFEIDLLGYYNEFILIIESKSFHPSPFFMMRKNRRYDDQFKDKLERIDEIKSWIFNEIINTEPKMGKICVYVYDNHNKMPSEIIFPEEFRNIDQSKIYYLYITQIKEYFEENRKDIIQVWYGDL